MKPLVTTHRTTTIRQYAVRADITVLTEKFRALAERVEILEIERDLLRHRVDLLTAR